jgi:glutathione S-transferase
MPQIPSTGYMEADSQVTGFGKVFRRRHQLGFVLGRLGGSLMKVAGGLPRRIHARPAYRRALERGGKYDLLK